eukprot:gene26470-33050_t
MDGSSGMFEMFLQPNPSDTVIATSKDMTSINAKIDFQYEHKPEGLVAYKGYMKALQGHKTTQCTSPRSPATPCVIVMTPVTPSRLLPSIMLKTLPSVVLKSLPCSPAVPRGAMFPSVKTSHQVAQLTSTTLSTTATGNTVVSIETAGWPGQLSRANSRVVSRPGTPQMVLMSPVVQALQTLFNGEIHALSGKSVAHLPVLQRGLLSDLSEGNGSVSSSVRVVSTRFISPRVVIPPRAIHIETIQQTHSTDSYDGECSVESIPSPTNANATVGSSHYNGRTMESRYVSMPRSTPAAASAAASKVVAAMSAQRPVLEKSTSGGSPLQFSPSALEDINIFVVAFKSLSKDFILGSSVPQGDQISVGDPVIVSVEAGEDLGYVTHMMTFGEFMLERFQSPFVPPHFNINRFVGQIMRIATPRECRMLSLKTHDEEEVLEYARCIARSMYRLPLNIRNVEYQFDRHQLTVFYEAQHHVDYREFVQNIHLTFKARVWMERVGG